MEQYGYVGKMLRVNLTTGECTTFPTETYVEGFLGSKGLAAKIYWEEIGPAFDTSEFSDEYSRYGEFTGAFLGMTCADRLMHRHCADFDFFSYRDLEPDLLPGAR